MKEISIKRIYQNFGMMNHKVVLENGTQLLLGNGETKRIKLENLPVKAYVKQGWTRSRDIVIDETTTGLIVKNERNKNLIAPGVGMLLTFILLPKVIWSDSSVANTISILGLTLVLCWIIHAFIIKRKSWILVEKRST
ncbi:MAG: hypothetical protein RLO17_10915 [Cyclobacteriaceae bacterium]